MEGSSCGSKVVGSGADEAQPPIHVKRAIRALQGPGTVRVYQAFGDEIAASINASGGKSFGPKFSMNRMSWVKPSFLWMMYRSGYATKPGQEHVFAIDIKEEGFRYMLEHSVLADSTSKAKDDEAKALAHKKICKSDIRCQWDPERSVNGGPLPIRSVQLGLRGEALKKYVKEWIVSMEEITPLVEEMRKLLKEKKDISHLLPKETPYEMSEIAKEIHLIN